MPLLLSLQAKPNHEPGRCAHLKAILFLYVITLLLKKHTQLVNSILPLNPAAHYGISPECICICCAVVTVVTEIVTA